MPDPIALLRELMVAYKRYRRRRYMCASCGATPTGDARTLTQQFPVMLIDRRPVQTRASNRVYRGSRPLRFCGYACFLAFCRGFVWLNQIHMLKLAGRHEEAAALLPPK